MPIAKKKTAKKALKKRSFSGMVIPDRLYSKEPLFLEKVARANEMLRDLEIDPDLFRKK
jgi:hypothetical protein